MMSRLLRHKSCQGGDSKECHSYYHRLKLGEEDERKTKKIF